MKKTHVILHNRGLSMPELVVYGQSVANALNKNNNFPNLYPKVTVLQSCVDALNAVIIAAKPGDKAGTAAVHAAETELNRVLKLLAAHVEYESNNDDTMALSSGFSLKQAVSPTVHGFEAGYGLHSGTVDLKMERHARASYIWQVVPDPLDSTSDWKTVATTVQAHYTVSGLKAGSKYWFRAAVVTKGGQQPFCDPIMLLVI